MTDSERLAEIRAKPSLSHTGAPTCLCPCCYYVDELFLLDLIAKHDAEIKTLTARCAYFIELNGKLQSKIDKFKP